MKKTLMRTMLVVFCFLATVPICVHAETLNTEESGLKMGELSFNAIAGAALGVVVLAFCVLGIAKWIASTRLTRKVDEIYENVYSGEESAVFTSDKTAFCFAGKMLHSIFPKRELNDLLAKYAAAYKVYADFGGNVYSTFNYMKSNFKDFSENELYSMLALIMLNIDGIEQNEDCSIERIAPFERSARATVKCVETIAAHDEIFGMREDKVLGANDNPIFVEGTKGISDYLNSIVGEDGTEVSCLYKGTAYIKDEKLDIAYELSKYSVRDAETKIEICTLWFNPYGMKNCDKCIDGFVFKKSMPVDQVVSDDVKELDAPVNITAACIPSSGKPSITWTEVEGANKYFIYRSTSEDGAFVYQGSSVNTEYTNLTAKPGTCYYYRIKAAWMHEGCIQSELSATCSVTCALPCPIVVSGNEVTTGNVRLTWDAIEGATEYEAYRATSEDGTYTRMYTTKRTSYTNTSGVAGNTYYYKVRAIHRNRSASSAYSNIVEGTVIQKS